MNHSKTVQCSRGEYRSVESRGVETSIHSVRFRTRDAARAATASSAKPQPGHDRFGWMVQGFNEGQG